MSHRGTTHRHFRGQSVTKRRSSRVTTLRKELTAAANRHEGLTGRTRLNAAGDRASGNYDFWAVCRVGNSLAWGKAAVYTGGDAKRVSGCEQQPR